MIDTEKIQRCGCEEDDCVEILGLEDSIYACFTCGYAGVTPSGAAWPEVEIHIGDLLAEVKRLREKSKKKGNVLSTLDEMIRNEESHVEMMKALEQGLDLPETWKEMVE